jgi:hypothetical protein
VIDHAKEPMLFEEADMVVPSLDTHARTLCNLFDGERFFQQVEDIQAERVIEDFKLDRIVKVDLFGGNGRIRAIDAGPIVVAHRGLHYILNE